MESSPLAVDHHASPDAHPIATDDRRAREGGTSLLEAVFGLALLALIALGVVASQWALSRGVRLGKSQAALEALARRTTEEIAATPTDALLALDGNHASVDGFEIDYTAEVAGIHLVQVTVTITDPAEVLAPFVLSTLRYVP